MELLFSLVTSITASILSGAALILLSRVMKQLTQTRNTAIREALDQRIRQEALVFAIDETRNGDKEHEFRQIYEARIELLRKNYDFIHKGV